MTEIKLHTFGEKLIVSEKVTLASGNINSAELHVTVDEAWAAYPNISAIFETKEYIEPVERLMIAKTTTEYVCVIPSEVLQKQGTLEMAIRGISNDGEKAKTSSYATYNIVKGASPGDVTLKPSMDLYQQYLAAMDEKTAPLFNAYKAEHDAQLKAWKIKTETEFAAYRAEMFALTDPVILWTNPQPDDTWTVDEETRIDVDLSGFAKFMIVFKYSVSGDNLVRDMLLSTPIIAEKNAVHSMYVDYNDRYYERQYKITDTGVVFPFPGAYEAAYLLVPYQIIGLSPIVSE